MTEMLLSHSGHPTDPPEKKTHAAVYTVDGLEVREIDLKKWTCHSSTKTPTSLPPYYGTLSNVKKFNQESLKNLRTLNM